ncbi:hypothetical protein C8R43DRAFT_1125644 [Mycena crocata]|nr:hypothetical protein C8R43DRAFT_1125644 [Mycena crocata]
MEILCADEQFTPQKFKDALAQHHRCLFTGATPGEDYNLPRLGSTSAFYTLDGKLTYPFVIFGEIQEEPEFYRGWPGRIMVSLGRPNWHPLGWPHDAFKDDFDNQILAMRFIPILDFRADKAAGKHPFLVKWAEDGTFKLEIRPTIATEYILSVDDVGQRSVPARNFPFRAGDTIIAKCTLYRLEVEHPPAFHWRGYSVVGNTIQLVNVAEDVSPVSSATLDSA